MTLDARIAAPGPKKILACDGGRILDLISVEILAGLGADLRAARRTWCSPMNSTSSAAPARER